LHSGHFIQLRTYVPHEWEWQAKKPHTCLVLMYNSKPFIPCTNTSNSSQQLVVTTDQHFWEWNLIHSAKCCSHRNV